MVVLPAYNAGRTLERTVREIPDGSVDTLLLVDDGSRDDTVEIAERLGIPTRIHTFNRGYGANQKTCYTTALEMGADIVVMLHPDYQYDPRLIPDLVAPIRDGRADIVLASRMADGGARAGGMPWWKRIGNRVLTSLQNRLLGTSLSELHTGYRAFSRRALERSGFLRFVDGFVFDAQMLVAAVYRGLRIHEIHCPARYLPDASSVGLLASLRYGMGCLAVSLRYRLHRWGTFPGGWMVGDAPEPMPEGAAPGLRDLVLLGFVAWRGLAVRWLPPISNYDTGSYFGAQVHLVSFTGDAPRPWPIPLVYSVLDNATSIVFVQVALGIAAWVGLAVAVASSIRHRLVAAIAVAAVLSLGLTVQAVSWDRLLMPESFGITVSVALTAAIIRFERVGTRPAAAFSGVLGGLLALLRPIAAPIVALLCIWEVFRAVRGDRERAISRLVLAAPLAIGVAWLALILPRQDVAYGVFEREVRLTASADYASDTWASVLWSRFLPDPGLTAWLDANGAPLDSVPDLRGGSDRFRWGAFRDEYANNAAWQAWFDARGGRVLTATAFLSEPTAHARAFGADASLVLGAPWGEPGFPEYGRPAPVPWPARGWFAGEGRASTLDLIVLAVACVAGAVAARRAGRRRRHPLLQVGLTVAGASLLLTVAAWFFVGVELVRHTAPGPLGIRLGFVLALVASVDLLADGRASSQVGTP